MSARRAMLVDDTDAVLERHRDLFDDSALGRASALAAPMGVAGLAVFAVWWLEISFSQIGPGLASLAKFVALMFPPSTGGHLNLLLKAMGETLCDRASWERWSRPSFAFPVSFLAAKQHHALMRIIPLRDPPLASIRSAASIR